MRTPINDRHFGLNEGRSLFIGSISAWCSARSPAVAVNRDYMNPHGVSRGQKTEEGWPQKSTKSTKGNQEQKKNCELS
jgi:hypothetical protein